jgi:hypothetical protein
MIFPEDLHDPSPTSKIAQSLPSLVYDASSILLASATGITGIIPQILIANQQP